MDTEQRLIAETALKKWQVWPISQINAGYAAYLCRQAG
jgi:hypothetical protein